MRASINATNSGGDVLDNSFKMKIVLGEVDQSFSPKNASINQTSAIPVYNETELYKGMWFFRIDKLTLLSRNKTGDERTVPIENVYGLLDNIS